MKLFSAVFFIFISTLVGSHCYSTFRIVNGNFSTSDVGTCEKPFYKLKAVSRYTTSLSAGCTRLTRTVNKIYVRFQVDYKRLGNYRKIMGTDFFEVCTRSEHKDNKLYEFFFDWIIPIEFVHHCPYSDDQFQLINLTYPPMKYGPWPDGFYRATLTLKDDIDYNIFSTSSVMRVTNQDNIVEF